MTSQQRPESEALSKRATCILSEGQWMVSKLLILALLGLLVGLWIRSRPN